VNLVDSSAWLEYFAEGPSASFFAPAIERPAKLIVPTVVLYEVFKRVLHERGESAALTAAALMQQGKVVDLSAPLALSAATFSHAHKLPLADSIIYVTARACDATLWTQDADFEHLPHVRFRSAARRK
jgi:predicted nucleic acid-binding protein